MSPLSTTPHHTVPKQKHSNCRGKQHGVGEHRTDRAKERDRGRKKEHDLLGAAFSELQQNDVAIQWPTTTRALSTIDVCQSHSLSFFVDTKNMQVHGQHAYQPESSKLTATSAGNCSVKLCGKPLQIISQATQTQEKYLPCSVHLCPERDLSCPTHLRRGTKQHSHLVLFSGNPPRSRRPHGTKIGKTSTNFKRRAVC